jgi:hypothetical protein
VLHIDIAEGFGDQRPGPPSVTVRRPQVENTQNAPRRLGCVFGRAAAIARFVKTDQPPLGIPDPPLRCRTGRTAGLPEIARVDIPSAASRTIRARWRKRCSVFLERTKPSSSALSASN